MEAETLEKQPTLQGILTTKRWHETRNRDTITIYRLVRNSLQRDKLVTSHKAADSMHSRVCRAIRFSANFLHLQLR